MFALGVALLSPMSYDIVQCRQKAAGNNQPLVSTAAAAGSIVLRLKSLTLHSPLKARCYPQKPA